MSGKDKYKFKKERKNDWYLLVLIAIMFIVSFVVYSDLPDKMPIHWNLKGEIDNYTSRFWGAFMMPLINTGILLLMLLTPLIDPRKENYRKFEGSYRVFRSILVIFFALLHFIILGYALGYNLDIGRTIVLAIALLFLIVGNYLPRIRPNYFLGIKSPWTLASEKVWRKTHRLAGKLFILSGLVMLISIFSGDKLRYVIEIVCILGSTSASIIYSYIVYQQEKGE